MPDKTDEERERIAKKLAEQRAKIEGMPTTAKVSSTFILRAVELGCAFKTHKIKNTKIIIIIDAFPLFVSSKLMSSSPMSMK